MIAGGTAERRRIVITGARGYIGTALTRRFARAPQPLCLVSRSAAQPALPPDARATIVHVTADLRQERAWIELLARADALVHLSWRSDLKAAEADPVGDDAINVEPVRALVRAAETAGGPLIIFASTVTIVGATHANPVDESTPDRPCTTYDRHKLACEVLLREATERGVLRAVSLRLANVYGFGGVSINRNRGILNTMMERAVAGQPLTLYGDGAGVRDFIHVDDVVEAICAALNCERVSDGRSYVIASGRGTSLAETFRLVAEEAQRATGRMPEIRHVPEPADLHPIERRNFIGNSRRYQELTGWRPRIALAEGVRDYLVRAVGQTELSERL
jgi:nucleoside-diphosphate-sugar epimerase